MKPNIQQEFGDVFENGDTRTVSKSTGMKWYQNHFSLLVMCLGYAGKIPLRQRVNPSKLVGTGSTEAMGHWSISAVERIFSSGE
jgi:hypothetical protein